MGIKSQYICLKKILYVQRAKNNWDIFEEKTDGVTPKLSSFA